MLLTCIIHSNYSHSHSSCQSPLPLTNTFPKFIFFNVVVCFTIYESLVGLTVGTYLKLITPLPESIDSQ